MYFWTGYMYDARKYKMRFAASMIREFSQPSFERRKSNLLLSKRL